MAAPVKFTEEIVYNGGINEFDAPSKIGDNQWQSGNNVEPLPDGARMRLGYTDENSVGLFLVDQGTETGIDSRLFVDSTAEEISQGFKIGTTANINHVEVRLKIGAGTPTVTTFIAIYTDNAGEPNAAVTDASHGDWTSVLAASLDADYQWFRFTLVVPVSLTGATQYHIVLRSANATAGNEVAVEENTAAGAYGDGTVHFKQFGGGTWTEVSAADLNFRLFTDNNLAVITGIKDYSLSDSTTERHIVFAGQYLYKNIAGTFTQLNLRPRVNEYVVNKDTHPSMEVGNDRLFLTDGTDPSQQFYINSAVEYYENAGIAAPTTAPTLTPTSGSALSDGIWQVDYYFYNSRTGQSSRRKYNGLSVPDTTTSNQHIAITGLPDTVEGRTNDVATSIRLEVKQPFSSFFRTLADSSGVTIDVAIGTTTVNINSSNSFTTLAQYDDFLPPQHTAKLVAENRQFVIGNSTEPWRLYFSRFIAGVANYESFPTNNFRDFGKGDGDYATALAFMSPRTLIVGFKNSIWALDIRDPGSSDKIQFSRGIGIANKDALIVQGNTLYFVSDADRQKGMFMWQPGMVEPELLKEIDDTFRSLNATRLDNCSCAYYAPDENRHQWWTTVSDAASSDQNKILVYDIDLKAWTDYDIVANVIGTVEESSSIEIFLGKSGFEEKSDSGSTDDGVVISAMFETKSYSFGLHGVRKKTRFIDYTALRKVTGSLGVVVNTDSGDGTPSSTTLSYPSLGGAFVLGTSTLGSTDVMGGGSGDFAGREAVRALGRLISYEYSSDTDFHLKTVSYGIQPTSRR